MSSTTGTAHARPDDEPCTTVHLPHHPRSAGEARHLLASELSDSRLPDDLVDDCLLVLAELVGNAVRHGRPDAEGNVEISWCVLEEAIRISVVDGGSAPHLDPVHVDALAERGRGLAIVDYLCSNWEQTHEDGTRVTAEISIRS